MQQGVPAAGWCPQGRRAEYGPIPDEYPLQETDSINYAVRTEFNVRDSEGTLIVALNSVSGGTGLTIRLAKQYGRPVHVVKLLKPSGKATLDENLYEEVLQSVVDWMAANRIRVLNIAGPRGSSDARTYPLALEFCSQLLSLALTPS